MGKLRKTRQLILPICLTGLIGGILALVWLHTRRQPVVSVTALAETFPVPHSSDAADDICIWVHPSRPELSTIIGTDKDGGIGVYDLSGAELQYLDEGRPNNIDLRMNFPLPEQAGAIVAASDRGHRTIALFTVDPTSRELRSLGHIALEVEPYGLCLYHETAANRFYAFITTSSGTVQQWELSPGSDSTVQGQMVRQLQFNGQVEGCVADDATGRLFIAEERGAVWRLDAGVQTDGSQRYRICPVSRFGLVAPDAEGLALYTRSDGTGYLIVSSQGDNRFAVFERQGDHAYLGSFRIAAGAVDAVTHTDGIEACSTSLGPNFPNGVFVAQDDDNDDGNQNFKLVPWQRIGDAFAALNRDPKPGSPSLSPPQLTE